MQDMWDTANLDYNTFPAAYHMNFGDPQARLSWAPDAWSLREGPFGFKFKPYTESWGNPLFYAPGGHRGQKPPDIQNGRTSPWPVFDKMGWANWGRTYVDVKAREDRLLAAGLTVEMMDLQQVIQGGKWGPDEFNTWGSLNPMELRGILGEDLLNFGAYHTPPRLPSPTGAWRGNSEWMRIVSSATRELTLMEIGPHGALENSDRPYNSGTFQGNTESQGSITWRKPHSPCRSKKFPFWYRNNNATVGSWYQDGRTHGAKDGITLFGNDSHRLNSYRHYCFATQAQADMGQDEWCPPDRAFYFCRMAQPNKIEGATPWSSKEDLIPQKGEDDAPDNYKMNADEYRLGSSPWPQMGGRTTPCPGWNDETVPICKALEAPEGRELPGDESAQPSRVSVSLVPAGKPNQYRLFVTKDKNTVLYRSHTTFHALTRYYVAVHYDAKNRAKNRISITASMYRGGEAMQEEGSWQGGSEVIGTGPRKSFRVGASAFYSNRQFVGHIQEITFASEILPYKQLFYNPAFPLLVLEGENASRRARRTEEKDEELEVPSFNKGSGISSRKGSSRKGSSRKGQKGSSTSRKLDSSAGLEKLHSSNNSTDASRRTRTEDELAAANLRIPMDVPEHMQTEENLRKLESDEMFVTSLKKSIAAGMEGVDWEDVELGDLEFGSIKTTFVIKKKKKTGNTQEETNDQSEQPIAFDSDAVSASFSESMKEIIGNEDTFFGQAFKDGDISEGQATTVPGVTTIKQARGLKAKDTKKGFSKSGKKSSYNNKNKNKGEGRKDGSKNNSSASTSRRFLSSEVDDAINNDDNNAWRNNNISEEDVEEDDDKGHRSMPLWKRTSFSQIKNLKTRRTGTPTSERKKTQQRRRGSWARSTIRPTQPLLIWATSQHRRAKALCSLTRTLGTPTKRMVSTAMACEARCCT
jgi:hypothetical protein